jgi:hypothetical protein
VRRWLLIAFLFLILLASASFVLAQSGDFELPWFTVDGGGSSGSQGGEFSLASTIGQPDAGILSGGDFGLDGGLVGGVARQSQLDSTVFLPFVIRAD